jgi:DNA mismatch repair protein MutS
MQLDAYTYLDLSIFHPEEEFSVFHRLNFTRTLDGREWLMRFFREPFSDMAGIRGTQDCIRAILERLDQWPSGITNGTVLVMNKFYDYQLDPLPASPDGFNSYLYRFLHGPDYSMVNFTLTHFADFVRTFRELIRIFSTAAVPARMQLLLDRVAQLLNFPEVEDISARARTASFSTRETVRYGHFFHTTFRSRAEELMQIHGQFDAWYSMAVAMKTFHLSFPGFVESDKPYLEAEGIYHLLLDDPVPYDIRMDHNANFIFLTGANMAGKSTFIKSIGLNIFLAHLGMGVPARSMKLSLFDGILSNINVTDNIVKGESYFYNEVQRIRNTVIRINDGRKWLVLIDELFKGTNIQDAMKCSATVIRGLIRIRQSLFILSTHLYEIGEELRAYPNISFRFFETQISDNQLHFPYRLREGISNDRLGYLILEREGVVALLESLSQEGNTLAD